MDDARLSIDNPLRPVDWRSQVAGALVRTGHFPAPRQYDRATGEIAAYLRLRGCRGLSALQRDPVARRYADLQQAYELRTTDRPRAAVEAMLLTDLDVGVVASRIGVEPACIQWYAAAFFDVRDRLSSRHFMIHQVIEESRERRGHPWCHYGWKLVAYLAGDTALEEAMGAGPVQSLQKLALVLRRETRLVLQEKARRLAYGLPADATGPLAKALQVLGATAQSAEEHIPNAYEENVQAFLRELEWTFGARANPNAALAEYEKYPAELRADEMLLVARGGKLPYQDQLAAMRLPEPHT